MSEENKKNEEGEKRKAHRFGEFIIPPDCHLSMRESSDKLAFDAHPWRGGYYAEHARTRCERAA
jgi:hypothetical protein